MAGDLNDLVAWREAAELAGDLVRRVGGYRGPGARDAADQIARASESVAANVAEAYGRGFGRDGVRFLRIARGSVAELESHLAISVASGRLSCVEGEVLLGRVRRIRALIHGLIKRYMPQRASRA